MISTDFRSEAATGERKKGERKENAVRFSILSWVVGTWLLTVPVLFICLKYFMIKKLIYIKSYPTNRLFWKYIKMIWNWLCFGKSWIYVVTCQQLSLSVLWLFLQWVAIPYLYACSTLFLSLTLTGPWVLRRLSFPYFWIPSGYDSSRAAICVYYVFNNQEVIKRGTGKREGR